MRNDDQVRDAVRRAIDECTGNLQALPSRREEILRAIGGEKEMKKKWTLIPALVMLLALAAMAAAVAETLGVNIFAWFGQRDSRYAGLAPYTVLEETSLLSVTTPELGETVAEINSAYYDGESLIVAYAIQNGRRMETFIPDEAFLERMEKMEDFVAWAAENDEEASVIAQWMRAWETGTPLGIVSFNVYAGDHTETDDGWDIEPRMEESRMGEDGVEYTIREYASPLREEIAGRDSLRILIPMYRSAEYLYFDGRDCYVSHSSESVDPMRAEVWKTEARARIFVGEGVYNGASIQVEAAVSAAHARLTLHLEDGELPRLPEDQWYDFRLVDENGAFLRQEECTDGGQTDVTITYEGTGKIPESLRLYLLVEHEGEWSLEEEMQKAAPIDLSPV